MSSEAAYFPDAIASESEPREAVCREPEIRDDAPPVLASEGPVAAELLDAKLTDERLLEQLRNGSKDALGLLFRRYVHAVRNVACRVLRSEDEADELVQEVFLFVFRKAGLFDPSRGSARSWLMQAAYHRAFDRRRYLRSRGYYAHLELEEAVARAEEPQAAVRGYEDTIEAALGRDALYRIEMSLSEVQRRVLRLRFFDGYTVEEIGAALGLSAGNVRNHYYRALEKLRRELFTVKLQSQ